MDINIKATNLELTPSLRTFIEDKMGSLQKLLMRFDADGAVGIWVEVGRSTRHHKKGPVYLAEADVRLPGKIIRAGKEDFDLWAAVDVLKDDLKVEIKKYKDRMLKIGKTDARARKRLR